MTSNTWNQYVSTHHAKNSDESNEIYSKWVETYDDDITNKLGLGTLKDDLLKKTIASIQNDESALLLDLAAGTGIAAERLRKYGYKGTMDAVERNDAMMERAKAKGMYRKYISFTITPEDPLPVEYGIYDAVTIVGAFGPNHLEPGCIKPASKCLKSGGVIAFYTRKTEERKPYVTAIEKVLSDLVEAGKLSPIEVKEVPHYDTKNVISDIDVMMLNAMFYVYRKV